MSDDMYRRSTQSDPDLIIAEFYKEDYDYGMFYCTRHRSNCDKSSG